MRIITANICPVCLSALANFLLFFSSLLFLIDFAPHDFFPNYRSRRASVEALRKAGNIFGSLPQGVNIKGESSDFKMTFDSDNFAILCEFIRERSPVEHTVNWGNAVGVGFSTISLPVGPAKLDAFYPLYIVELPQLGGTVFQLRPVGQLLDLDRWLADWRQTSLTKTALLFLFFGFLLQLVEAFRMFRVSAHKENQMTMTKPISAPEEPSI